MTSSQTLILSNDEIINDHDNDDHSSSNSNNKNKSINSNTNDDDNSNDDPMKKFNFQEEKKLRFKESPKVIQRKFREEVDEEMNYEQVSNYLDRGVYCDASEKSGTIMLLSEVVHSASTYNIIHNLPEDSGKY